MSKSSELMNAKKVKPNNQPNEKLKIAVSDNLDISVKLKDFIFFQSSKKTFLYDISFNL